MQSNKTLSSRMIVMLLSSLLLIALLAVPAFAVHEQGSEEIPPESIAIPYEDESVLDEHVAEIIEEPEDAEEEAFGDDLESNQTELDFDDADAGPTLQEEPENNLTEQNLGDADTDLQDDEQVYEETVADDMLQSQPILAMEEIAPYNEQPVTNEDELQAALQNAEDGDTITLADNIYLSSVLSVVESGARTIYVRSTEDNAFSIFAASGARHLSILGDGLLVLAFNNVIFDGNNDGGGFLIGGSSSPSITIQNAQVVNCHQAGEDGGGILLFSGSLTIDGEDTKISNNTANRGAGIYIRVSSQLTINSGTVSENTATDYGGGIFLNGAMEINDGDIKDNYGVYGGGIHCGESSSLLMNDGTISGNNSGHDGGGINILEAYSVSILGGSIINNSSDDRGGGISVVTSSNTDSYLTIKNTEISNNEAAANGYTGHGGGLFAIHTNVDIEDCHISGNSSPSNGGGIALTNGTVEITNSTIQGNSSRWGGGLHVNQNPAVLINVKILDNTASRFGGGLYTNGANMVLTISGDETSISENTASDDGGGIYSAAFTTNVQAGTFARNKCGGNGGAIFSQTLDNLYVYAPVEFSDNEALAYFDEELSTLSPTVLQLYETHIFTTVFTSPFTHGYNNYDISAPFYTVRYILNGGSGIAPETMFYFVGEMFTVADADLIVRPGFVFAGWCTQSDGQGGIWYAVGHIYEVKGNLTLYAVWYPEDRDADIWISYNGNGHTGGVTPATHVHTPYANLLIPGQELLVKDGHVFNGWNSAADGSGKSYIPGSTVVVWESQTLYAQWVEVGRTDRYSLYYDGNGAEEGQPPDAFYQYSDYIGTGHIISGRGTLEKERSTFIGWNTRYDGRGTFYAPGDMIILNENITLYAQWNPDETDGWIITLRHYNERGETIKDAEQLLVEYGSTFIVEASDTGDYRPLYYMVQGDFKQFAIGTSQTISYNITITIYHASNRISVSYPTSLEFYVDETTYPYVVSGAAGDAVITNYSFTNSSDFPVEVVFGGMQVNDASGLDFVPNAIGGGPTEIHLGLALPSGVSDNAFTEQIENIDVNQTYSTVLGRLGSGQSTGTSNTGSLTINGYYAGYLTRTIKKPSLTMTFQFTLITDNSEGVLP